MATATGISGLAQYTWLNSAIVMGASVVMSLLACFIPAYRISRICPARVLRGDS
ncbi:MAG: hypothetical protein FWE38_00470 [Firmicutes bacterium]|nr:hypothetical protein [Bacillota bacterium]